MGEKLYCDQSLLRKTLFQWHNNNLFKEGCESIDEPCSGQSTLITEENMEKNQKQTRNRFLTVKELAEDFDILIGSVDTFKRCFGLETFVKTQSLNILQKHRVGIAEQMLKRVKMISSFIKRIIVNDRFTNLIY